MTVTVKVPTPLRKLTGGQSDVEVDGATVREVFARLDAAHDGFQAKILDDTGEIRRFINVYVNDEDVRDRQGLDTAVSARDVISVVPAIAGGR
jgi:molybdopterin synthase sulfur carrier subunit